MGILNSKNNEGYVPRHWGDAHMIRHVDQLDRYPEDYTQQYVQPWWERRSGAPHHVVPGANTPRYGRPGSIYKAYVYDYEREPPAYKIRLIYTPECYTHPLVTVFHAVRDQTLNSVAQRAIQFQSMATDGASIALKGNLPRVVKIRRNGETLLYRGPTDPGALYDWVMNETYLNEQQSV